MRATPASVRASIENLGNLLSDLTSDYNALTSTGGASWLAREVLRVHGDDVVTYLHGQVTQDVEGMAVGESKWSFILQPHGKVDGFLRLSRIAETEFLVDCDRGQPDALIERLERFKMRTKIEIEKTSFKVLAIRGIDIPTPQQQGVIVAAVAWKGMNGFDLIGENPVIPEGIHEVDDEAYEALRISVGFPVMGAELDQLTIPAEAGANDLAISFAKGCYTGQELVARIDARGGNVPRHLRAVVFECDEHVPRGATIVPAKTGVNVKPFGTLTSVAFSPKQNKYVGLALVRRDGLPPVDAIIEWDDGPTPCRIEQLPLEP